MTLSSECNENVNIIFWVGCDSKTSSNKFYFLAFLICLEVSKCVKFLDAKFQKLCFPDKAFLPELVPKGCISNAWSFLKAEKNALLSIAVDPDAYVLLYLSQFINWTAMLKI